MSEFPYRISIRWSEQDDAYVAQAPAVPGAGGDGATPEEAIALLRESVELILAVRKEHNDPIPAPDCTEPEFSGQIRLRMPRSLHRALALEADREGVSLNQFMVNCLTAQLRRQPLERFTVLTSETRPFTDTFGMQHGTNLVNNFRIHFLTYSGSGVWKAVNGIGGGVIEEGVSASPTEKPPMIADVFKALSQ